MSENVSPIPDLLKFIASVERMDRPYENITFCLVAWNEEARLGKLLEHIRPYFKQVLVGVQKSTDSTLEIAKQYADAVYEDQHWGFGDATFGPGLLPAVKTDWTFKLDADEWPTDHLLDGLGYATMYGERNNFDGIWLPFHSAIEGGEYKEQHSHLRLFQTRLGWPPLLHSRPPSQNNVLWDWGWIEHNRSLDEMIRDYLRYYKIGQLNQGWTDHNRLMMYWACLGTAAFKGWDWVRAFEWWPEVEAIAFTAEKPWEDQ